MPPEPSYGDVWLVTVAGHEVPRLIVSSDLYHAARPASVLTVHVDTPEHPSWGSGLVTAPVTVDGGSGTALLDLISTVSRGRLIRRAGQLDPEQHAGVGQLVRNLIGP